MNHTIYIRTSCKDLVESGFISDINIVEVGLLSADQFYAIEDFLRGIVEVVYYDDFVASLEKCEGGERADVARTTAKVSRLAPSKT
jgi:hypothetical protein